MSNQPGREPSTGPSVLHVFALGEVGGVYRVVQGLATAQRAAGQDAQVAAILDVGTGGHPLLAALREAGVPLHPREIQPRAYGQERREIGDLIRRIRPDVVHTHDYRTDVVDAPVARRLGVPVVATVHGFTGGRWKNRLYQWLQLRSYRTMDAVVAVSGPLERLLQARGVPARRLRVVRNAWAWNSPSLDAPEARAALGVENGSFHIGWVGRVSREKGPDVFLDALRAMRGDNVAATVVGDGPERLALEAAATTLPVRWPGIVHDAGRLFRGFDVFVLSSRTEGTPIVLFEAMAAGTPVVATAVGGVPDVLAGECGWLVPPERPDALAAAIAAVRSDPAEAARRAGNARGRLEREYDSASWVRRYREVYEDVVAGRRSTARGAR